MALVRASTQDLDRIDWNFPSTGTSSRSIHALHWFPGNFIPQIPSAFIQILSKPGDLVLDPFCGSGTTGVEAVRLDRRALLSDRVTACRMISQAKIDLLDKGLSRRVYDDVLAAFTWEHLCRSEEVGINGEGSDPNLRLWYAPGTLSQLRYIWKLIERQSDEQQRRILTLIFSDVLFTSASPGQSLTSTGKRRRHHWGWIADNVHPRVPIEQSPSRVFSTRMARAVSLGHNEMRVAATVLKQDARNLGLPSESVDLVVTSPPYISVIDYTRANRLLYMWMGWPFDSDKAAETGARFKRSRSSVREDYLSEMRDSWLELNRVMRQGSYCAIVIGESRAHKGTVERTIDDLRTLMPCVWGPVERNPTRRRVSERSAREATEYLYVFQRPWS